MYPKQHYHKCAYDRYHQIDSETPTHIKSATYFHNLIPHILVS